tara:strand:+ start:121 stop:495 length:375 start_codon:yes stop_codon:yes gene_type:complete
MGSGKAPKKTAAQNAMERQQRDALNEETASSERRLKAVAQKQIGKESLLGTPMEQAEGPAGPMITEGYRMSGGTVKKIPKPKGGLFGRVFKSGLLGGAPAGMGIKNKSLIGKGAEKAVKKAVKK